MEIVKLYNARTKRCDGTANSMHEDKIQKQPPEVFCKKRCS